MDLILPIFYLPTILHIHNILHSRILILTSATPTRPILLLLLSRLILILILPLITLNPLNLINPLLLKVRSTILVARINLPNLRPNLPGVFPNLRRKMLVMVLLLLLLPRLLLAMFAILIVRLPPTLLILSRPPLNPLLIEVALPNLSHFEAAAVQPPSAGQLLVLVSLLKVLPWVGLPTTLDLSIHCTYIVIFIHKIIITHLIILFYFILFYFILFYFILFY